MATLGKQAHIGKYFKCLPSPLIDPSTGAGGWLRHDYQGKKMGREEYGELENMHGLIKIRFDKFKLLFPFLLFSMQSDSSWTHAPVMHGEDYYTTPFRCAWLFDIPGMEIHLFDCEYCKDTCKPVKQYMGMFEELKNKTSQSKKEAEETLKESSN